MTSAAAKKNISPLPNQRDETELAPELTAKAARLATAPGTSGLVARRSARHAAHTNAAQKATNSASPVAPSSLRISRYSLCAPELRYLSFISTSVESGCAAAKEARAAAKAPS